MSPPKRKPKSKRRHRTTTGTPGKSIDASRSDDNQNDQSRSDDNQDDQSRSDDTKDDQAGSG